MENENIENLDSTNETEDTVTVDEEAVADTVTEEPEAPEFSDNEKKLFARAKKAEAEAKDLKARLSQPSVSKPAAIGPQAELNSKDLLALMNEKVHQDDVDDVVEYAKFKGIPVNEALASSVVKNLLAEKVEQRTTASAANVGGSKRSSGQVSDSALLAKASKGDLPESEADIKRLVELQIQSRKNS